MSTRIRCPVPHQKTLSPALCWCSVVLPPSLQHDRRQKHFTHCRWGDLTVGAVTATRTTDLCAKTSDEPSGWLAATSESDGLSLSHWTAVRHEQLFPVDCRQRWNRSSAWCRLIQLVGRRSSTAGRRAVSRRWWWRWSLAAHSSFGRDDDTTSFSRKDFSSSSILLASSCRLLLLVAFVVHLTWVRLA